MLLSMILWTSFSDGIANDNDAYNATMDATCPLPGANLVTSHQRRLQVGLRFSLCSCVVDIGFDNVSTNA